MQNYVCHLQLAIKIRNHKDVFAFPAFQLSGFPVFRLSGTAGIVGLLAFPIPNTSGSSSDSRNAISHTPSCVWVWFGPTPRTLFRSQPCKQCWSLVISSLGRRPSHVDDRVTSGSVCAVAV